MTKFGGKWDRVDLLEHCERDPHSADANVVETLDLVNAACTAWLAKKGLFLSWESDPATNPAYFRPAPSRQPIHGRRGDACAIGTMFSTTFEFWSI
jgi:hypothetical protein